MFDIVAVADFSKPRRRRRFEWLLLFLLGSYREFVLPRARYPIHIGHIGEPPKGVRRMAEWCGARLVPCDPHGVLGKAISNKQRGLEIGGDCDRVLLVDCDVLFLQDPRELADLPRGIAASPSISALVPDAWWREAFAWAGVPYPSERIPSLSSEIGWVPHRIRHPGETLERHSMVPYFNGGIVYYPRDCGFAEAWPEMMRRIVERAPREDLGAKMLWQSDQTSLAVAIQHLAGMGVPWVRLPNRFHGRAELLNRGALALRDAVLFHMMFFIKSAPKGVTLRQKVEEFFVRYAWQFDRWVPAAEARHDPVSRVRQWWRHRIRGRFAREELRRLIYRLLENQVEPALRG